MQFREALKAIQEASSTNRPTCRVLLVTGFTPLHLQTFLHAHLQRLLPTKQLVVSTGLYGDLAGTLFRFESSTADMCAVALEWPDLDPRLGFRQLGGWGPKEIADILVCTESKLITIRESLAAVPSHVPLAFSLPTLALPPVFHTPSWQLSAAELRLRHALGEFALRISEKSNIRLINAHRQQAEPPAQVFDFKGELLAGLPYTTCQADRLGQLLAQTLVPAQPKKGLITDLDDTLWAGIAGEIGPQSVSWDLASHAQLHGLYQQLLRSLAEQGVLIGVASKNDPDIVEAAFRRTDILLPRDYVFPVEAHWNAKSESLAKILDTWNLHADSVVFVEDSPSEIAEVKAAHPCMECLRFDAQDYAGVHSLLYRLRDLFAKQILTEEDGMRRTSLRTAGAFRAGAQQESASYENFLREAESKITPDFNNAAVNRRSLELVNKTNQFNLNGIRYTESEWHSKLSLPGSFSLMVSYRDKYGALGVIALLAGQASDAALTVNTWVMSCRAFGRRIEHQCLKLLLERFPAQEIWLEFSPTARNGYLLEFSGSFLGQKPDGPFKLSRTTFLEKCPMLYHEVEMTHD
ncbi:MAG: HAD-IIIC family phosphatase [Acidobacteriia bacterium]|nr:HAD-IIIC family phosphatase [Terriglobia bacterium]